VVVLDAQDSSSVEISSTTVTLTSTMQTVTLAGANIKKIYIRPQKNSSACRLVIDDVSWNDDTVNFEIPASFGSAIALKKLQGLKFLHYNGSYLDGGALMKADSRSGLSGYSGNNVLGFDCTATMRDGGIPQLPESIILPYPSNADVSLKIGSATDVGKRVLVVGIKSDGSMVKKSVTLNSVLETVRFSGPSIAKIRIHPREKLGGCKLVVDDIVMYAPSKGVTYSQQFYQNATPSDQCTEWNTFQSLLTGSYSKITIAGTYDPTGVSCSGSMAQEICSALYHGQSGYWSCDGRTWMTGDCGPGLELSAAGGICQCPSANYIVRPCIGNANWGGAQTETCSAPTQVISVVCE
jgi:hypothetical protein